MNSIFHIYDILLDKFGHQHWWPGESRFEIIIGAILTQNTNWQNVEKAIKNIKNAAMMEPAAMHKLPAQKLAALIRPAGYYNIKAARIKNFLDRLFADYNGSLEALDNLPDYSLRQELLTIKGIGRETADSIMLYAYNRPVFVVDAYTARILSRHGIIDSCCDYEQLRETMESALPQDRSLFNEYHALLVKLGKDYCRSKPKCEDCPLNKLPIVSELVERQD